MTAVIPTGNTYDKYTSRHPIERRLMERFFVALDGALPDRPPQRVLEVGIGEGEVTVRLRRRFNGASVIGADLPDPSRPGEWRARGIVGMYADIGALPFRSGAFDLVMALEVLEHVPDPAAALRELARVSAGHVVVSVPREPVWRVANMARGRYLSALGNTPGHIQHWSRRGFTRLVGSHLDIVTVSSPFPWTMIAARPRSQPDRPDARRTGRPLDDALQPPTADALQPPTDDALQRPTGPAVRRSTSRPVRRPEDTPTDRPAARSAR